jgi:eukaryotic-like serine/threonine-protein kinase
VDDDIRNNVDLMAEEFVERLRRGEAPAIEEYAQRVPEQAAEIRELFPLLRVMEHAAPDSSQNGSRSFLTGKDAVPVKIGDYRILREVGRGGMGIVYEAEQISLGRHVAIKVLPDRAARNTKRLFRFHREARSAGRLHHTNIVPVFDVGCEDGIHYYTMQFIQGNNLDAVIAEVAGLHRGNLSGVPASSPPSERTANRMREQSGRIARNLMTDVVTLEPPDAANGDHKRDLASAPSMSPAGTPSSGSVGSKSGKSTPDFFRNVARIGMQVADALAYAHDQRILHRDIKPGNLLLDIRGNVWVTDFGLAKTEDDGITETGDIVGTYRFIAPERFKGAADARSDIYSLGLTLYELLTLRSCVPTQDAFARHGPRKLLPPRMIDPLVPRDLETVVLKAIAHEPKQRYENACRSDRFWPAAPLGSNIPGCGVGAIVRWLSLRPPPLFC